MENATSQKPSFFQQPWVQKAWWFAKASLPYLLMLLASTLPFVVWFKNPEFITGGDDMAWHKVYVYDLVYGWKNGFSGISLGHQLLGNLGYNIYTFYAPFSHYLVGFLAFLGMRIIDAWKIVIIGSIFLSGVFTYRLALLFTKDKGIALAFGIAYIFSPYRLYNILYRAALAESFAQAFIPLLLLGIFRILKDEEVKVGAYVMTICGTSILILSHPFTALLSAFLAVGLVLANFKNLIRIAKKKTTWIYLPISLLLVFGLVAFYFIPMQQALNTGLYRMSDEEAVWTSVERLIKHLDGSWKYSGYLNPEWLKSYSGTYAGETATTWMIDIGLFMFAASASIVVLTILRKKGKRELGLAIAVIVSLLPVFFSRREEVLFAVPLFAVIMVFITMIEDQREAKDRGLKSELLALAKNPETYVLIVALVLAFMYLLCDFMWQCSPAFLRKGQFPFRFWSIINVIIIVVGILVARAFVRYRATKYVVATVAILWYITSLGPIDKRIVYYNHQGSSAEPTLSYIQGLRNIGVMNEYMPRVFYDTTYESKYTNSLYYSVRNQILYTKKFQWGIENYMQPSFLEGNGTMEITALNSPNATFAVTVTTENALVQLPQFFYDGYRAVSPSVGFTVVGENADGLVAFRLPKGAFQLNVEYVGPQSYRSLRPLFYVSIAGLIVFGVAGYVVPKIIRKHKSKPEETEATPAA